MRLVLGRFGADGGTLADILLAPASGWDQILPRQSAGMSRTTIQVGDVTHDCASSIKLGAAETVIRLPVFVHP